MITNSIYYLKLVQTNADQSIRDYLTLMTNHINNTVDVRLLKIGRALAGELVSPL